MWTYNGRTIRVGRSWTDDNNVKHPTNWNVWSDDYKAEMGLVWEDEPESFDNRFYWSAGNPKSLTDVDAVDEDGNPILDENGVQIVTKGLKSQAIEQTKVTAGSLLAPTDWMVIKAAEVEGYSVPADVLTYRAAVRTASNDIESAINACTTHDAFMALYDAPVDAEGNPTGNAPINDWPDTL